MARMNPAQRRQAIVDAALQVMIRKGMASTTARDVATQLGTSSGLLHHYFASMDDLLAAAFEQAAGQDLEGTRTALAAEPSPLAQLTLFFATYTRAEQDWAFQLWLDAWAEAARRPAVRATSHRLNVAWQQLLADTIRAGISAGQLTCSEPEASAWRILSLLDGLALQAVAHRVAIERQQVVEWSIGYAERELGLEVNALRPRVTTAPRNSLGQWTPSRLG